MATRPRLLILADDSDARIHSDVAQQATQIGFHVTFTASLGEALSALGIEAAASVSGDGADMDCDNGGATPTPPRPASGLGPKAGGLVYHDVVVSKLGRKREAGQDVLSSVSGLDLLHTVRLFFGRRVFFVFHSSAACRDPCARWGLFQDSAVNVSEEGAELLLGGCNMVTTDRGAFDEALRQIFLVNSRRFSCERSFSCPWCGLNGVDEDSLCIHCPLYHTNEEDKTYRTKHPIPRVRLNPEVFQIIRLSSVLPYEPPPAHCPVCSQQMGHHLMRHIHNDHGPRGRGEKPSESREPPQHINSFSLVVCVHDGHILLVQERSNAGYWLPGGHVDGGETLEAAALRETTEEAGVDVKLTGIMKIQYKPHRGGRGSHSVRLRVIFLAAPGNVSEFPKCKTLPDYESCGAAWVKFEEVLRGRIPLRSPEPYTWVKYLHEKGEVHSLDVLSDREY